MRLIPSKDPFSLQQNGEKDPSEKEECTTMIARIWRGVTSAEQADEYFEYLMKKRIPFGTGTKGNAL